MKNLMVIFFLYVSNTVFGQEVIQPKNYQDGINILFKTLNDYRSNLNRMDSIMNSKKGTLSYKRQKTSDSTHPFKLNKKLCDEALKRCKYNFYKNNDVFKSQHLYHLSNDCVESIYMTKNSINSWDVKKLKNAINTLIIDREPLVGHRKNLLNENKDRKYVGFGYIIVVKDDQIGVLVMVITSTLKGLQDPLNFNNTYIDVR